MRDVNAKTRGASRRSLGVLAPALYLADVAARSSLLDRIASIAIAAQFALLVAISVVIWQRYGLTADFGGFYHGWSAIAHGDLNPSQQDSTMRYIQNHGEIITWILAPLYWLIPSALGLRLIQDVSTLGCSIVAYWWVRDLLAAAAPRMRASSLVVGVTALALIVLNPWPVWSNAFDFHWQATGTLFLLAAAYAFFKGKVTTGLLLSLLVVTTGDIMCTILAGLGLSMLFVRRVRLTGIAVLILGLGAFFLIHRLGAGIGYMAKTGGLESLYEPLFAPEQLRNVTAAHMLLWMTTHPLRVLAVLASQAKQIYANISPTGVVGIAHPWTWGVCLITLLENSLTGSPLFSQPSFQSYPIYALTAVGTGGYLIALAMRARPGITYSVCVVLALNVAGWAAFWLPHIPSRWILVRPAAAAELGRIDAAIPRNEEVIAGAAFVGRFADRPVYYNGMHSVFPIQTSPVNILIAPYDGINILDTNVDLSRISALAQDPHARLVSHNHGVWWFSYTPGPGSQPWLSLAAGAGVIPAWTLDGISGKATIEGPLEGWRMEYDRQRGGVFFGDYWRLPLGSYHAFVDIEATEPVIFEVRNAAADILIVRRELPVTPGRHTYGISFGHVVRHADTLYSGWGPFQYDPIPFGDNPLEVRLWAPGTGNLTVYRVAIVPIKESPHPIRH